MRRNPGKPQDEIPAPSLRVRLAWWIGLFLVGTALFTHEAGTMVPPSSPWIPVFLAPFFIFMSPCGLAMAYGSFFHWLGGFVGLTDIRSLFIFDAMALVLAYATYLGHLALTRKVKTYRAFLLLMLTLGLLIIAWSVLDMIFP